jgi:hypothetical protein
MAEAVWRIETAKTIFGMEAADCVITDLMAPWVPDLARSFARVHQDFAAGGRGLRAGSDRIGRYRDGGAAAWNGYRAMTRVDQTTHFLRPVNF